MPGRDAATKELIFRTYRQMGRRDLPADSWALLESRLATALLPPGSAPQKVDPDRIRVCVPGGAESEGVISISLPAT